MAMQTKPWAREERPQGTLYKASDLLDLHSWCEPRRRMMIDMARTIQDCSLVGNPAPRVQQVYERYSNPQIGDLVVERSTVLYRTDTPLQVEGFGFLLADRLEWMHTEAEWAANLAEEFPNWDADSRPTDRAIYIQYGPNPADVCRWHNADVWVVIPKEKLP